MCFTLLYIGSTKTTPTRIRRESIKNSGSKLVSGGNKKRQRKKPEPSVFGFEGEATVGGDSDSDSNLDSDSGDSDSMMKGSDVENNQSDQEASPKASKSSRSRRQQSQHTSVHPGSIDSNASGSLLNSDSLFDLMMSSKNRDAYFWQYNVQSKGPKTKKVLTLRNRDPHLHRDFHDPVFQLQNLNSRGGAALNKLRKGDGNDVTPNADKLYNLGNQIHDFIQKSYQINNACFGGPQGATSSLSGGANLVSSPGPASMQPLSTSLDAGGSGQPPRMNLKREKNKIASRACRLKKKAQHEANKIKLFGLNEEHSKRLFISTSRFNNNIIHFIVLLSEILHY